MTTGRHGLAKFSFQKPDKQFTLIIKHLKVMDMELALISKLSRFIGLAE